MSRSSRSANARGDVSEALGRDHEGTLQHADVRQPDEGELAHEVHAASERRHGGNRSQAVRRLGSVERVGRALYQANPKRTALTAKNC